MAQVLKDEVRNCILEAANVEIISSGIEGVQMRKIAERANMTVGNLYRYFEDKDALIYAIVEPAIHDLDGLIQQISNQQISLLGKSMEFDMTQIYANLEICAKGLAEIFYKHKSAMLLISSKDDLQDYSNWFKGILVGSLSSKEPDMDKGEVEFLSSLIATSVIKGMQECFRIASMHVENEKNLDHVILKYLQIVLWK